MRSGIRRGARLRAFGMILGAAGLLAVTSSAYRRATEASVTFREHLVDRMPGVYQCSVADLNGDGKPDIIALSSGKSEIAWYENPTWKKHTVTTSTRRNIDCAAYDLDGDGKLEIVVASEFDLGHSREGGRLQWFKPRQDPAAEWEAHDFALLPTAHRVRWADWDGDGRKELVVLPILGVGAVAPNYEGALSIVSYAFKDGKVRSQTIDHSLTVAHGLRILDYDGDGRYDLLVASFEGVTLFQPLGKGDSRTWKKTALGAGEQAAGPKRGSSEVDRGWLEGKRPFLATIEPWHGSEVAVYTPPANGTGLWKRQVIDDSLEDGHALACADLDGDGQSEIIAGYRGGEHNLYGYRCVDRAGAKWERFVIDAGDMAGSGIVIVDLNGDGRPDIVACGSATANVKWYENLGARK